MQPQMIFKGFVHRHVPIIAHGEGLLQVLHIPGLFWVHLMIHIKRLMAGCTREGEKQGMHGKVERSLPMKMLPTVTHKQPL